MAQLPQVYIDWDLSPRLIQILSSLSEISIANLHDTLRNLEAIPSNLDDRSIIETAGGEDLGGGVSVGLTATLNNAQVAFEPRLVSVESGTITTGDANGERLIDSTALFQTNGVEPGATVVNLTDGSATTVVKVISEIELQCWKLKDGSDNQFQVSDAYKVWNVEQCQVSGGNLVAVDDIGDPMSAVFPTAFTQVILARSTSAVIQGMEAVADDVADAVWDELRSEHTDVGSFGATDEWAGNVDEGAIADAVWDEDPAEHVSPDTFGLLIGDMASELSEVRYMDGVYVSDDQGSPGVGGDQGTRKSPISGGNLVDAITVATARGLRKLIFLDDSIYTPTQSLQDFVFYGETIPILSLSNSYSFAGSTFYRCYLSGTGCAVSGANECACGYGSFTGIFFRCLIVDNFTMQNGTTLVQCTFDCPNFYLSGDSSIQLGSGNIVIKNMTYGILDLQGFIGEITVDSSCTGGTINLSGHGNLTNNTGGTTVNTDGWLEAPTIADEVWGTNLPGSYTVGEAGNLLGYQKITPFEDAAVWLNGTDGASGTTWPRGTKGDPVDNLADAITIAQANGLKKIKLVGYNYITLTDPLEYGWVIEGDNVFNSYVDIDSGVTDLWGLELRNVFIFGNWYGQAPTCIDCWIGASTNISTTFVHCYFWQGLYTLSSGCEIIDCYSAGSDTVEFSGNGTKNITGWSGRLKISNHNGAGQNRISFKGSGDLILANTVTNGEFIISGIVDVVDNSTGSAVITRSAIINLPDIDSQLSGTHGSGSWEGSGASEVATAVWEEAFSGYVDPTQMGYLMNKYLRAMIESGAKQDSNLFRWIIYDPDAPSIPLVQYDTKDADGNPTNIQVFERVKV